MFSVAKIIDGIPENQKFLSSVVFVYDKKSHVLAQMLILVLFGEFKGVFLDVCNEGPDTFDELLAAIHHLFATGNHEGQRLIHKEGVRTLREAEHFAVEHLWPNLPREMGMAAHEEVAQALTRCLK